MNDDVEAFTMSESTSRLFEADLEVDGVPISGDLLDSLSLTLRQDFTGEIIAERDAADVLNANGVTVDTNGHLMWTITPAESVLLNRRLPSEPHRVLFEWTYFSGTQQKRGTSEFLLWITRNAAA
jgi:hypothetical protein